MSAERTLLLASLSLPAGRALAEVARGWGWRVLALDEVGDVEVGGARTFYGGTDRVGEYARRFGLCLIEPPLDLIARVPYELRGRQVSFGRLGELKGVEWPVFVKPADPINRCFDAGVYRAVSEVRGRGAVGAGTAVIVSEVVEWTAEFRCFVREGRVEGWSPYLSFGRPVWRAGCAGVLPESLRAFCGRLVGRMAGELPPAFVVDVGVMGDGRWGVVEFNPAWCSGGSGAGQSHMA